MLVFIAFPTILIYTEIPFIKNYPKPFQNVVSKSFTDISDQDPANQPRSKIEP